MGYVNLREIALQAFDHIKNHELDQADTKLTYLLNITPHDQTLIYYLGCLLLEQKKYGQAITVFERAIQLYPDFDQCMNNMSTAYRQVGDLDTCRKYFAKAVEIAKAPEYLERFKDDPKQAKDNLCDYLGNLGSCFIAQGTPDKALTYFKEALEIDPNNANVYWNQGLAFLEKGDYEKGFLGYDYGDRVGADKERSYSGNDKNKTPWWEGPKSITVTNPRPTVVVYGEQGIGDEIMFASILPDIMKDADIILESHPRLMDLFRLNFPDIPIYGTRKSPEVTWIKNHKVDAKLAIGSLAKFYRKKKEDFPGTPYLKPNSNLSEKMKRKVDSLSTRKKIGISWKGGIGVTNKVPRCIELELLKPLFDFDADFISLQYHSNAQAEVDAFNEASGATLIHHWPDVIADYDLTAAMLPHLDLIISVPQSVVHLAGALGVKTIQMCPIKALWQMGVYGEHMPWYGCVRNMWQLVDGDWKTVVANVINLMEFEGYTKC